MRIIDLEKWERLSHYKFFKAMDYPHYNICTNIDITNFLQKTKEKQISFYYAMIFAVTHNINAVEEFRYRIRGEQVVLHDKIHASFTDMSKGSELFKLVVARQEDSIECFASKAKAKSIAQKDFVVAADVEGRDDLIYITCIPWISFTHISHTISLNKDDSVPRISWGKYYQEGKKIMLPFSVQAHHSFVDGIHIGKYINKLQIYLQEFR